MSEQEYRVTWEVDVSAENARDAAEQALAMVSDPGSIAHVFTVTAADGTAEDIDLDAAGTERLRKIKVRITVGRKVRTLTYQTAQDVAIEQEVQVPRWPGMGDGQPLRGTVVALSSDYDGQAVTIIGG